jgi:pimeloyl-ACP methyl ester carboxylesterase
MTNNMNTPTVVLVHGGFADASFWTPVVKVLQARGLPVLAPPNPLRGLASDAAYISSFVRQIDGPVLLVGHSYGGAVISVAGADADNVVGLVYVAAFILDEGESFAEVFAGFPPTPLGDALRPGTYPLVGGETALELTIAPELYRSAFAADLPGRADRGAGGHAAALRRDLRGSGAGGGVEEAAASRSRRPRTPHGTGAPDRPAGR